MRVPCVTPLSVRGKLLGGPKPILCIPLVARSRDEVLKVGSSISSFGPDFVELRIDYWDFLKDVSEVIEVIAQLRRMFPETPFILTCRDHREGGFKEVDLELKRRIYEESIKEGLVDFIDLELALGQDYIDSIRAKKGSTFLILSYHEFSKVLSEDEIFAKFAQEAFCGADVIKVAIMPKSHDDLIALLNATLRARRAFPGVPIISMAMGEVGVLSRIVGFAWGSDLSFAMFSEASAPGQVSASVLSNLFKVFEDLGLWRRW